MLYATKTGTAPAEAAAAATLDTARRTSPVQLPIHAATGCAAMRCSRAASPGRDARTACASRPAAEAGFTYSLTPAGALARPLTAFRSPGDIASAGAATVTVASTASDPRVRVRAVRGRIRTLR